MMQAVSDMARSTPSPSAPLHARGSNQGGVRQYNERVVLQAIRLHGALPKADLARITHLSAQAVSLIIDRLLAEDLVRKQAPVRGGRVGQPSVPIALNPDGAFSVGDLVMVTVLRRPAGAALLDAFPPLAAYVARGEARPAYRRAFDAQQRVFLEGPPKN